MKWSQKEAVERVRKLWLAQCAKVAKYQAEHGPDTWGDCPSDAWTARQVGYREGLRDAKRELERRGDS